MPRKKKRPAAIVAIVMATGLLTGLASIASAKAAPPIAPAAAQGVIAMASEVSGLIASAARKQP